MSNIVEVVVECPPDPVGTEEVTVVTAGEEETTIQDESVITVKTEEEKEETTEEEMIIEGADGATTVMTVVQIPEVSVTTQPTTTVVQQPATVRRTITTTNAAAVQQAPTIVSIPSQCTICGKILSRARDMKRHVDKVHKNHQQPLPAPPPAPQQIQINQPIKIEPIGAIRRNVPITINAAAAAQPTAATSRIIFTPVNAKIVKTEHVPTTIISAAPPPPTPKKIIALNKPGPKSKKGTKKKGNKNTAPSAEDIVAKVIAQAPVTLPPPPPLPVAASQGAKILTVKTIPQPRTTVVASTIRKQPPVPAAPPRQQSLTSGSIVTANGEVVKLRYGCPICNRTLARARDMKRHIRLVHEKNASASSPATTTKRPKMGNFDCTQCTLRFFTATGLDNHVAQAHAVPAEFVVVSTS